jgi:CRP-like cAMP-binding protein
LKGRLREFLTKGNLSKVRRLEMSRHRYKSFAEGFLGLWEFDLRAGEGLIDATPVGNSTTSAWLVLSNEGAEQMVIPLGLASILVGRDPTADLNLPASEISKNHASITFIGGSYVIKDNGSTNGTFVNGVRTSQKTLFHDDKIQFGPYLFHFQTEGEAPSWEIPSAEPAQLDRQGQEYRRSVTLKAVKGEEQAGPIQILLAGKIPSTQGVPARSGANHLPATGLIAHLKEEDRVELGNYGTFHTAEPGKVLIEQGAPHGRLYFTVSGLLHARRKDHGKELLLGSIGEGEWIGEVDLFDPSSAVCSVVAVEPTRYWVITRNDMEQFINKKPSAGAILLIGLAATLGRRIRDVTVKQAAMGRPRKTPVLVAGAVAVVLAVVAGLFAMGTEQTKKLLQSRDGGMAELSETLGAAQQHTKKIETDLAQALESLRIKSGEVQKAQAALADVQAQLAADQSKPKEEPKPAEVAAPLLSKPAVAPTPSLVPSVPLSDYPPEITLVKETSVPLMLNDKVTGSMKLLAGRVLKVTGVDKTDLLVNIGGASARIPVAHTDFQQALEEAKRTGKNAAALRKQAPPLPKVAAPLESLKKKPESESNASAKAPEPPAGPKEATLVQVEEVVEIVGPLKAINTLKEIRETPKENSKAAVVKFLRSETAKWQRAAEKTKSLLKTHEMTPPYHEWFKKILLVAEMFETERFDLIEPKLREIDQGWLTLKTEDTVQKSTGAALETGGQ